MLEEFETFLTRYADQLAKAEEGLARTTSDFRAIASQRILASLQRQEGLAGLPEALPHETLHERLAQWVLNATPEQKALARLDLPMPPAGVHFVAGQFPIFYDFKNTDIVLDELEKAGVEIRGRFFDFGCSSGRNLAVLKRAYGDQLSLYGADPAAPSIDWLNAHVSGVQAVVSNQNPPLPFEDASFDIVIAKSIWTHFSPQAGRIWFDEIRRVMSPGGHFLFSTHGPHDIASRLVYDNPKPRYERFAGHEHWTRDGFLLDLVAKFDRNGYYFQPYKAVDHQGDLGLVEGATTADWGLMFVTEDYLRTMLSPGLTLVSRAIARTGNRHDVYVVRRD